MARVPALLLLLSLILLPVPPEAQAAPLPVSIKGRNESPKLLFGQTYQELAKPWQLMPWPDDTPRLSLLPAGVVSRQEIIVFEQPFLTRFIFDQPNAKGQLIALQMVHWETSNNNKAQKACNDFITAIQEAYGAISPSEHSEKDLKVTTYQWPEVLFSNRKDQGGQTWYLTLNSRAPKRQILAALPLGKSRQQLDYDLEPYFESNASWPALAWQQPTLLELNNGSLAARTLFLFDGFKPSDKLVGVRLILPLAPENEWNRGALQQLVQNLEMNFGKAQTPAKNTYVWKSNKGSLWLKQDKDRQWVAEFLAALLPASPPPGSKAEGLFPPSDHDIEGWSQFKWHMPLAGALNLCPPTAHIGTRAHGQDRFIDTRASLAGVEHSLRLSFNQQGLEEIMFNYDSLDLGQQDHFEHLLGVLSREYGDHEWQSEDEHEKTLYWSRNSGYLKLIKFKEPNTSWRVVFTCR